MGDPVKIEVNGEERTVGEIQGGRFVAKKTRKGFCRKYSGYGINYEAFVDEIKPYVDTIVIEQELDDGKMHVYMSTPADWEVDGHVDKLGTDKQIFLALDEMTYEGKFDA